MSVKTNIKSEFVLDTELGPDPDQSQKLIDCSL